MPTTAIPMRSASCELHDVIGEPGVGPKLPK